MGLIVVRWLIERTSVALGSLRLRLALLVLLPAVPIIAMALYSHIEQRHRGVLQAQSEALRVARLAADSQRSVIDEARLVLPMLAALPEVREGDVRTCNTTMVRLRDNLGSFQSLGVIDRNGTIICSALPEALGVAVADRTYVQRAVSTRRFAIGDYQVGRASRTANVNFGYPVVDADDTIEAVVYASMNLGRLNQYAAEARLDAGTTLTVLDGNGTILVRHPDPERWIGQPSSEAPLFADVRARLERVAADGAAAEGSIEGLDVDGTPRVFAYVALDSHADASVPQAMLLVGIPTSLAYADADRNLSRNLLLLVVICVGVLCAALLGANRLVFRPIDALVDATRRLSAGDLAARTGLAAGADEISQLAYAFDKMAVALQDADARRAQEEILRRRNYELEQQNLAIQEANRLKTEFVSMVSHEMRTPLTSIQGYVYLLLEGASGDLLEEQRQFLSIVHDNSGRLLTLITDLLDLSRMEAGRLELHWQSFDLADAIRDVVEALRPLVDSRQQAMHIDLPDDLPPVWADRDRAIQIVTNLVSNAHKYTPVGGQIWVSACEVDDQIEVSVRDNGIGLSQDDRRQLFTRFFRARSSAVQQTSGTGLGLAITQALVTMHGGQIRVASAPGQGSTFSFTLPMAPSEATRPAPDEPVSARR